MDEFLETCDDINENVFINIVWKLADNRRVNQTQVVIRGSQHCYASNTAWFLSGRVPGSMVVACDVTEEYAMGLRKCNLQCQCPCGDTCDYLHFRVQMRSWMKTELSLCHYEHYYDMPWYNWNGVQGVNYATLCMLHRHSWYIRIIVTPAHTYTHTHMGMPN